MVVQRFWRAYMESPPPTVFHYKYQSYKYERNTAGKSASDPRNDALDGEKSMLHDLPLKLKKTPNPKISC